MIVTLQYEDKVKEAQFRVDRAQRKMMSMLQIETAGGGDGSEKILFSGRLVKPGINQKESDDATPQQKFFQSGGFSKTAGNLNFGRSMSSPLELMRGNIRCRSGIRCRVLMFHVVFFRRIGFWQTTYFEQADVCSTHACFFLEKLSDVLQC